MSNLNPYFVQVAERLLCQAAPVCCVCRGEQRGLEQSQFGGDYNAFIKTSGSLGRHRNLCASPAHLQQQQSPAICIYKPLLTTSCIFHPLFFPFLFCLAVNTDTETAVVNVTYTTKDEAKV